jgi:hypothetical protein
MADCQRKGLENLLVWELMRTFAAQNLKTFLNNEAE